jgi:hypothetical protein
MKALNTWAGRSSFQYEGSVKEGTKIFFGTNFLEKAFVSNQEYQALLKRFNGRAVNVGTSRTNPPRGSLGEWLINCVTKVAIASYVSSILINEGYAEKQEGPTSYSRLYKFQSVFIDFGK